MADIAVPDVVMVGVAAATVFAVWTSAVGPAVALGLVAAAVIGRWSRSWWMAVLVVGLTTVGGVRAEHAWSGLTPDRLGPYDGWVRLVVDPQTYGASTRLVVAIEGERFEVWCRGRAQQARVRDWRAGELVAVSGTRRALADDRVRRVASQHVVGAFDLDWASDVEVGNPLARASNRVRSVIERGASWMPAPERGLFRGLVIGDDRDQPADMVDRFRASGLSHLTAVSGQNVAFLLGAFGPLLVRLRPAPRWIVTVGVVAWFVALTRFEPSIVRAGAMAALSATAYATGRERAPVRLLAIAVSGLVLVDPLLVWSVGFWMSVGATAGVCAIGPPLARRLARLGRLAVPLGITLGAQLGVVVPSVLVFGRLPLVSIPANLMAVPVAGAVMLYGLPAALVAGALPVLAPVLMLPALVGTRWVDAVAQVAALVEPDPPWVWLGWAVVVLVGAALVVSASRSGKNRRRHDDTPPDR
ncbi:MAG: ComEC/Rec2 family competence protein [Ilumatobacteraceae bacterium]